MKYMKSLALTPSQGRGPCAYLSYAVVPQGRWRTEKPWHPRAGSPLMDYVARGLPRPTQLLHALVTTSGSVKMASHDAWDAIFLCTRA